jgi:ADP-heptose:LPS heptosyltransferase
LTVPYAFFQADDKGMKILAVHSGGIGDLLLALPALRAFRYAFPDASLELMGFPERLSLIAHDLGAHSIHSIDQSGMAYFYGEGGSLPSRLADFFSSFSTALVLGQSGAKTLSENLKRAGLKRVIHLPSFPQEGGRIHISDFLVQSLRPFGIEGLEVSRTLRLPKEAISFAEMFLKEFGWKKERRIMAIHPGSGSRAKNWSPENFAHVADWVGERAEVLLISGPSEDGLEEARRRLRMAKPRIAENLPLLHLAAILKNCTAFLGNDSGITHLAAQLGIPTVAIFGPTNPAVWGPRGPNVEIIGGREFYASCLPQERNACEGSCLKKIIPEMVTERLAAFLKETQQLQKRWGSNA